MARRQEQIVMSKEQISMSSKLYGDAKKFPSTGRWGAWVTEPKDGELNPSWVFLGAHLTRRLALRCQDRALLKLQADSNMPIQLSFPREDYQEDEQMRKNMSRDEFFDQLRDEIVEAISYHQNLSTATCLGKFMAEEKACGNLTTVALEGPFYEIDLNDCKACEASEKVAWINGGCVRVIGGKNV